jgi:N-methylhydantoinase A
LNSAGVPLEAVTKLIHGTTVVTNLLIERTGEPVGLICTRGFRDVLEIQLSFRTRTFDSRYRKVDPLVPRRHRLEIGGRIDRDGHELEPLEVKEVSDRLDELYDAGIRCLAVSLYNAYANPTHEQTVAAMWRERYPDATVSCATDVDPRLGEYERVSTVTLNASAVPKMVGYVAELASAVSAPTSYMHSAGGVLPPDEVAQRPILLAFSGPAACWPGRESYATSGWRTASRSTWGAPAATCA